MKSLLIAFALILPLISFGQDVQVTTTKNSTIYSDTYEWLKITRHITNSDTSYVISFKNAQYTHISDYILISADKDLVMKVTKGLLALTDERYKAGESTVSINSDLYLSKVSYFGDKYSINAIGSKRGWTMIPERHVRNLVKAVSEKVEHIDY